MRSRTRQEGINHHLWVISYADMVTLLFALFVVLYSLGEVKLSKLRELRQSLAFAFSRSGEVLDDTGSVYEHGDRGEHLRGLELFYAQDSDVRERLLQDLPRRFEEITGRTVDVLLADDRIEFRGVLEAFFEPGSATLRASVRPWLHDLVDSTLRFTTRLRVRIESPNVVIGRDASGRARRTGAICMQRLEGILRLLPLIPRVLAENVETEFRYLLDRSEDWEAVGTIAFVFSDE